MQTAADKLQRNCSLLTQRFQPREGLGHISTRQRFNWSDVGRVGYCGEGGVGEPIHKEDEKTMNIKASD